MRLQAILDSNSAPRQIWAKVYGMIKWISAAVAVVTLVLVGISFLGTPRYAQEAPPPPEATAERAVTEQELQLYIDVYKAMQSDHSLKIEDVASTRGIAIADFRSIERRVQSKSLLVERVRTALLEHAKQQPVLALQQSPPGRGTPEITPAHE